MLSLELITLSCYSVISDAVIDRKTQKPLFTKFIITIGPALKIESSSYTLCMVIHRTEIM